MKILLIDTCGVTGSVALADTALAVPIIATAPLPDRAASERLIATIRNLTASASLQSLDAIAVVSGPGSFTGVRVGLSAAKGLCEALNLPLIAVSRLAILAHLAKAPVGIRVIAGLDAGRGEFYCGIYCDGICLRESLVTRDQLLDAMAGNTNGAAHKIVLCESAVAQSLAEFTPLLIPEPTAADALPLVLRRLQANEYDDIAAIDANYLRRTDAEIFAKPNPKSTPAAPPTTEAPAP